VLPVTASNRNYTLSVSDGATVSGNKTILFPLSGKYTITATSDDDPTKYVSKEIVIALKNPTVTSKSVDDGILVSWDGIEGATSYVVTRTGDGNSVEKTVNQTSYTDTDVYTSVNYTYTVVAKCEDSTFDSLPSLETSTLIMGPSITIELPNELTSVELLSALKSGAGINPHMTKNDALSLKLTNEIEGVTDYAWYLNGKKLVSGDFNAVKEYTILPTNNYLNTFAVETANTLMFAVVKDGYTYSATINFGYIENDPGNIYLKADSSTVKYGEPLTLETEFENLVSIAPEVEWTSSDSSIATVENGVVTALTDGSVTITATIKATGASDSVELKSFIPVKEITFNNSLPTSYLIRGKNGVTILNSLYESVDLKNFVTVTAVNGKEYSVENNLQWTTSDSSIATVNNGVVTPTKDNGKGGVVTITYYTDTRLKEEGVSGSIDIVVRDYGIIYNSKDITGTKTTFSGTAWAWEQKDYTLNLGVNGNSVSSYSEGSLWWCFDHNENKTVDGSAKSTIDFSSNTNAQTVMQVRVTAYTPYISLFIKDLSGNNICEVFFERGA
ncbi:Ig-like domain-containing protein, partial [Bullifex sp.]|uniref:Ig-like domain-containing protein n=1 Tax=Bullifex sp. TaxID=2815808 RepID=UPI002A8286BE